MKIGSKYLFSKSNYFNKLSVKIVDFIWSSELSQKKLSEILIDKKFEIYSSEVMQLF